ncbi:MAG: RcpC/CpaB family pilus assembly protein [Chloroflexota bacterium]|nr:RcpC/CpaB family pilus assembly protein [Chloroflexota bacterium]
MRRSGRLLIVVGVVMGLAAVLLALFALSGGDDEDDATTDSGPTPQDITIVQASVAVDAHVKLTADDLEEVIVQDIELLNPDDHPRRINEVIGFAYSEELVEGQQILRSRLEVSGIAEELPSGSRAISMLVDQNNLVAGLIRQDDSIDIVYEINAQLLRVTPTTPLELPDELTLTTEVVIPPFGQSPDPEPYPYPGEPGSRFTVTDEDAGNPIAKIVLQNIRVLRVITPSSITGSSQASAGQDAGNYLVLEVTPDQAELVHMMTTVGTYQVMLRGVDDEEIVTTMGANMELLVTEYDLPVPKTVRLPEAGAQ